MAKIASRENSVRKQTNRRIFDKIKTIFKIYFIYDTRCLLLS